MPAAIAGIFFAFGVAAGMWGGSSGAILARSHVDAATFGFILTVYTGAYLIAMSGSGTLAQRLGVRSVLSLSGVGFGGAVFALLAASSGATMATSLIASGFLGGTTDVLMNAEGARIERRLGKPILARLHAAASSGMAIGAILGSLVAASAVPWAGGLAAALGLALACLAYDIAARKEPDPPPVGVLSSRGLSLTPMLVGLGVVIGVSIAAETASLVWSALLLRAEAPQLAAVAGLGASFFSACQATLRFNADFVRLKVSDERIIVASFALAAIGFAMVAATGGFVSSVAGFALIGLGTGAIVPCAFALAARQTPAQPAVGLSSASLFSAATRLPAPLLTGAIAQSLSLTSAFAAFAVALVASAVGMAAMASAGARRTDGRKASLPWRAASPTRGRDF